MYYAASDVHLGAGSLEEQRTTERLFTEWLDAVSMDATVIFLCGDIFDFWYEYSRVVPKGFVRSLAKIAELTDRGVRIVFMSGNHDMWVRDYFERECGMEVHTKPTTFDIAGKRVHIAHGDNLNIQKSNLSLRLMNGFFRSGVARWCFSAFVHPNLALKFGQWWSSSSRKGHKYDDPAMMQRTVGYLKEYAKSHLASQGAELYIFGHLHHAGDYTHESPSTIFMNDWSSDPQYVAIDQAGNVELRRVKNS